MFNANNTRSTDHFATKTSSFCYERRDRLNEKQEEDRPIDLDYDAVMSEVWKYMMVNLPPLRKTSNSSESSR